MDKPAIVISFDLASQMCDVQVEDEICKNTGMAKAILRMALEKIELQERFVQAQQLSQAAAEAQRTNAIRERIKATL